ncbi:MAG: hypothetical protein AAFV45_08585 [Pseudomonadota bacterium]
MLLRPSPNGSDDDALNPRVRLFFISLVVDDHLLQLGSHCDIAGSWSMDEVVPHVNAPTGCILSDDGSVRDDMVLEDLRKRLKCARPDVVVFCHSVSGSSWSAKSRPEWVIDWTGMIAADFPDIRILTWDRLGDFINAGAQSFRDAQVVS